MQTFVCSCGESFGDDVARPLVAFVHQAARHWARGHTVGVHRNLVSRVRLICMAQHDHLSMLIKLNREAAASDPTTI